MNMLPNWIRASSLAIALVVLVFVPNVEAKGAKGGHAKAPHMSAPKAPHMSAPKPHPAPHASSRSAKTPHPNTATSHSTSGNTSIRNHTAGQTGTTGTNRQNSSYARNYAHRRTNTRRYGSFYGYRRNSSNQATRGVVSMLRSAHSSLARIDHDYKGHRVQAMRSIRTAIRQLSHSSSRSYGSSGRGLASFSGTSRSRSGTGSTGRRHLSQAASDARMRQVYQKLQSADSRLGSLGGTSSTGASYGRGSHTRARMHIQQAGRHLTAALSVR